MGALLSPEQTPSRTHEPSNHVVIKYLRYPYAEDTAVSGPFSDAIRSLCTGDQAFHRLL